MVGKLVTRRSFWLLVEGLLFVSLNLSPVLSPSVRAQGDDIRRVDMLEIAERYATYEWVATVANWRHDGVVDTPDAESDDGRAFGGWWVYGQNTGIPYYWGGWSSIADDPGGPYPDLNLIPDYDGLYFHEQMAEGHAAGDVSTGEDSVRWTQMGGVDCAGFVSRVWRTGARFGTSKLFTSSRPIEFKDLRLGDMVEKYDSSRSDNHVMLFKEFVNLDPQYGPIPGLTTIRVYEAAVYGGKVVEREHLLVDLQEKTSWWRGALYKTNAITLRRLEDGRDFDRYTPRTYLTPIDIVQAIDRSGSMSLEFRMARAKEAAKMFVELMRTGDKIGVVDFDTVASVTYPLTEIDSEGVVKAAAMNAIDTLYARGLTSIGGGLRAGRDELNARGQNDPVRVMILLSDGRENQPPFVPDVLPEIVQDKIAVHTVGLGSSADQSLLASIADRTGGVYRFAPSTKALRDIFNAILVKVYGESVVSTASGVVPSGETVEESALLDSTIGSVSFSLFWPGSDLDLTLVQPDGRIIDPSVAETDPHISFTSGDTYEFYKVYAPQFGEWTMRVFGKSTSAAEEEYSLSVSAMDALIFSVEPDRPQYYAGDPVKLTASVEDSLMDFPSKPEYILGLTMRVTVEDPAQNQYAFDLHDDGLHGDGKANDGVYANAFGDTSLVGSYNFSVQASGVNNRHGQPFTREHALSTVVSERVVQAVQIDIKPGSDPNVVNLKSRGVIPVSILTTEDFDASTVDPLSVRVGPDGATESHGRGHIEDVDGDGDLDLMLHFRTEETGIQCGDTSVSLTAETFQSQALEGFDSIKTIGCK